MLRKEAKIFLTAVMFLTRIRVPARIDHHPDYLQKSPKYFPMVGWIVGGVSAAAFVIFNWLSSPDIAILASMVAGILTTGAFHEDGFADVCDGFGGGWTREKILLIMKDSRIGAFGAIGLIAVLAAKFVLLKEIFLRILPFSMDFWDTKSLQWELIQGHPGRYFLVSMLAAHSLSRLMPLVIMRYFDYSGDFDTSKSKPLANGKSTAGELAFAILTALLPFTLVPGYFLLTIPPALFVAYWMARYFKKWVGGYTGDCLGAIQQVSELVVYLDFVIVLKYVHWS